MLRYVFVLTNWWPFISALSMFLHMLTKVSLLRVGLATILADVRLEVLALLVLGYVLEQ